LRPATQSISNDTPAPIAIGDLAPDFALTDLSGATRTLADFGRRPLLVNFWAT